MGRAEIDSPNLQGQFDSQPAESLRGVDGLAAALVCLRHHASGQMMEADGGFHLVPILAPGAAPSKTFHATFSQEQFAVEKSWMNLVFKLPLGFTKHEQCPSIFEFLAGTENNSLIKKDD
jgi:hypothetical protein